MRSDKHKLQVSDVLNVLANEEILSIFDVIFSKKRIDLKTLRLLNNVKELTNKQFYSRMIGLTNVGLVKKEEGIISVTSFGIVVHSGKMKIDSAINEYHKLKAVDSIEDSNEIELDVRCNLIKGIINDENIRKVLLNGNFKS